MIRESGYLCDILVESKHDIFEVGRLTSSSLALCHLKFQCATYIDRRGVERRGGGKSTGSLQLGPSSTGRRSWSCLALDPSSSSPSPTVPHLPRSSSTSRSRHNSLEFGRQTAPLYTAATMFRNNYDNDSVTLYASPTTIPIEQR
jgi:hypothetical protein